MVLILLQMAADTQRTSAFVTSAVKLLMAHQFDGLDVDWEYPTRDGAPEDKVNETKRRKIKYCKLYSIKIKTRTK